MKHVMVDLETFGNGPNACVVQIGACYFDPETGKIGETFKINIDAESAARFGAQIDASTVYWWLSQSEEASNSIIADPKFPIHEGFSELNDFLNGAKEIWSHATFDFVIITETLKRLGIKPKFHYRAARDIRTLMNLTGVNSKKNTRSGVHHDALDDAIYQVAYCVEAFKELKCRIL